MKFLTLLTLFFSTIIFAKTNSMDLQKNLQIITQEYNDNLKVEDFLKTAKQDLNKTDYEWLEKYTKDHNIKSLVPVRKTKDFDYEFYQDKRILAKLSLDVSNGFPLFRLNGHKLSFAGKNSLQQRMEYIESMLKSKKVARVWWMNEAKAKEQDFEIDTAKVNLAINKILSDYQSGWLADLKFWVSNWNPGDANVEERKALRENALVIEKLLGTKKTVRTQAPFRITLICDKAGNADKIKYEYYISSKIKKIEITNSKTIGSVSADEPVFFKSTKVDEEIGEALKSCCRDNDGNLKSENCFDVGRQLLDQATYEYTNSINGKRETGNTFQTTPAAPASAK